MIPTRRRSWRIAPRVLGLSSFIAVNAHAQDTYELRCRGGADAFSIERLDASTFSLNFTASPAAAAADGSGLEPGTCSWIDRSLNNEEPRQIQFSTARSRGPSVSIHLNDPANFWSFFVYNTNNGYFQSGGRHSEWTKGAAAGQATDPAPAAPPSGGPAPASSGGVGVQTGRRGGKAIGKAPILEGAVNPNAKSDPYPYEEDVNQLAKASSYTLSNVRIEPGQKFVNITFVSLTGAAPFVEVGQASPRLVGDTWTYRDATIKVPAVPVRADSDKPISRYDGYDYDGNILNEFAPSDWKSHPSSNGGWEWTLLTFPLTCRSILATLRSISHDNHGSFTRAGA